MSQNVGEEKDVMLALALASGKSINAAAEEAGVCRRTVERRLATPEFRRLVGNLRHELVSQAVGRLADNMCRAADRLAAILDNEDAGVQLRTARTILWLGMKLRDAVDTTERIRDIEDELARKGAVEFA